MLVSLVVPLYNEEIVFPHLRAELLRAIRLLESEGEVEVILVNDGSSDGTWFQIMEFAKAETRVKGVSLSRNFGKQAAMICGYHLAKGDVVLCMDGDLQDPPDIIRQMLEKWKNGADVVFSVRRQRFGEPRWKLFAIRNYYKLMARIARTQAPRDSGDFRLLSRRALDAMLQMGDRQIYVSGMAGWIGYRIAIIEYDRQPRAAGTSKLGLVKLIRLALDGIISFSQFPLRLGLWLYALAMTPFLIYLCFALPGPTTLLACLIALGAINILALAILGEYLGRVFDVVRQRPLYFVMDVTSPDLAVTHAPRKVASIASP